ncbi:alpha/beta fold hydrolase [Novosphingobium pentaromativorans]|uniref:AB hydrolase-1 domain-containing protein n=1 Tax=Novosphingobium pentaromativorans US6-1 TaxID=1088721 RepID=G6E7Z6_9SPHN|nr:alpha/beta fold hydrolase [Novosphingobium pentaromativorans]AIT81486.1 hypothetical protein JI59_17760 [Novosphingobium pentaromativorans US6-1]EHJ62639.1 hypothetical protein NSU_0467 [Novosphingobium pentaromativorans US6-1]
MSLSQDGGHGLPGAPFASLEASARRITTASDHGDLVWRLWGDGPPLLLLHGAHGAWSHWICNIEALSQHYTVIAPDLPGCGESAPPPREENETIVALLAQGLREISPERLPVDVVGFSFGGVIAAFLAICQSDVVRRLILLDTGGLDTPRGDYPIRRMKGLEGNERREAVRANLQSMMLADPARADDLAVDLQLLNVPRCKLDVAPLVLPDRLLRILPEIPVPVSWIWGEKDRLHPDPALQAEAIRSVIADFGFHVVPDGGHWIMYERPQEVNRLLLDLLAQPARS